MQTTAGSHALSGSIVPGDAELIKNLRAAGAIILGKANLAELSGPRTDEIGAQWSGRGGYCYSAYVENGNPLGSSCGSAVGVSAGFAGASLGGDTNGSITCPTGKAACYALRPTVGLIPTKGCIPLAATLDVVGPIGKSAYDVALLLSYIARNLGDAAFGECAGPKAHDQVRNCTAHMCLKTHLLVALLRRLHSVHPSA